jgi:hypothetical protein
VVVLEAEDDESATAIMVLELGARGRPQDDDASSLRPRGDVGDRIGRLG